MTERVFVDTNILVAAYDPNRPRHLEARALLESDPRDLAVAHQSLREFVVVLTRPVEANGHGLDGPTASAAWRAVTSTVTHLPETEASQALLLEFVDSGLAVGKQVHDANLVAIALDHGASTLITANPRHFSRFSHLITIESLS